MMLAGERLPLLGQIHLIGANVFEAEMFGAGLAMPGKPGYIMDVTSLRVRREVPDKHVFDHASAKWVIHALLRWFGLCVAGLASVSQELPLRKPRSKSSRKPPSPGTPFTASAV